MLKTVCDADFLACGMDEGVEWVEFRLYTS